MRIIGMDLSLRSSGICIIPSGWTPKDWKSLRFAHYGKPLGKNASEKEHLLRMLGITSDLIDFAEEGSYLGITEVFVEHYAFSKGNQPAAYRLRELGGIVKAEFLRFYGNAPQPIIATAARKITVGKLKRKNQKKQAHAILAKMGMPKHGPDELDAFIVANAGLASLGLDHVG